MTRTMFDQKTDQFPSSLRILVADDNEVNQQVAARFLEYFGHQVHVVGNGQLALDALRDEHFDVVLMDVQMPLMDGLEAVATLRRQEQGSDRHQPVIALTAHVSSGDRELCLQCGMDDYLGKPIDAASLEAALVRVLNPEMCNVEGASITDRATGFNEPAAFDFEASLARFDGDYEFLSNLATLHLETIEGLLQRLEKHLQRQDFLAAAEAAHVIKGNLASLGAEAAFAATLQLERECRDQAGAIHVVTAHQVAVEQIERFSQELQQCLSSWSSGPETLVTSRRESHAARV